MVSKDRKKMLKNRERRRVERAAQSSAEKRSRQAAHREYYENLTPNTRSAAIQAKADRVQARVSKESSTARKRRLSQTNEAVQDRIAHESQRTKKRRIDAARERRDQTWRKITPRSKSRELERMKQTASARRAILSDDERAGKRSTDSFQKRHKRRTGLTSPTPPDLHNRTFSGIPSAESSHSDLDPWKIKVSQSMRDFAIGISNVKFNECSNCKEGSFFMMKDKPDEDMCARCKRSEKARHKFSTRNNVDPGEIPVELSGLTNAEALCIARATPIMHVYKLPGGQTGYRGHVTLFRQKTESLALILPRLPDEIDILVLRKKDSQGGHRDFRVRREKVRAALKWLQENNPYYKDITVDPDRLDALPEDGEIDFPCLEISGEEKSGKKQGEEIQDGMTEDDLTESFVPSAVRDKRESAKIERAGRTIFYKAGTDIDRIDTAPLFYDWPELGTEKINEFEAPGYMACCFPTLFCNYKADYGEKRDVKLDPHEYFKHLLLYRDGRFAKHPFFRYFALNTLMRWNALKSSTVYIRQHVEDSVVTLEDLKKMSSDQQKAFMNRILYFSKNIRGSRGFWKSKRKELTALIDMLGTPHVFFTLSFADTYCQELHDLLKGYNNDKVRALLENPHVADAFFSMRIGEYVKTVLCADLEFVDFWYRIEYQHRGSPHIHGLAWIRNAPSIQAVLAANDPDKDEELIRIIDKMVCTWNPTYDENGKGPIQTAGVHPCGIRLTDVLELKRDPDTGIPIETEAEREARIRNDLCNLVNRVQRHINCREAYCLRPVKGGAPDKLACRFNYPFPRCPTTDLKRIVDEDGEIELQITTTRNDPRVNSYNPLVLFTNRGNCDFQWITNSREVKMYVAKYTTKQEPRSYAFADMFREVMKSLPDESGARKMVQSLLMKMVGERDISCQETWHLLMSLPLDRCSRTIIHLNLGGGRVMDLAVDASELIKDNKIDQYKQRPKELEKISMFNLFKDFTIKKMKGQVICNGRDVSAVVVVHPYIPDDPSDTRYEQYCLQRLVLHKPFRKIEELKPDSQTYAVAWSAYAKKANLPLGSSDFEKAVFAAPPPDQMDADQNPSDAVTADRADDLDDWMNLLQIRPDFGLNPGLPDDCFSDYEWVKEENSAVAERANRFLNEERRGANVPPFTGTPDQLNAAQRRAYDIITQAREPIRMIVYGSAGTGKTFLMNCLRGFFGNQVKLMAPTGTAAFSIGGQTIHSAIGYQPDDSEMADVAGERLLELQKSFEGVTVLLIDEVSMIGRTLMGKLDKRLRQAFPSHADIVFGNRSAVFFGDFAQLPPVLDLPLYSDDQKSIMSDLGRIAYSSIDRAVILTENQRQKEDPEYAGVLSRVRNCSITENDFRLLQTRMASSPFLSEEEIKSFADAPRIFTSKEDVAEKNAEDLLKVRRPIAKIDANHEGYPGVEKAKQDDAGGLSARLCLCQSAKVMLTRNLCTELGLTNGTTGTVQSIVYTSHGPPTLPDYVVCSFPGYRGDWFDANIPHSYPIKPIKTRFKYKGRPASRETLPLQLSFAMTTHKRQGCSENMAYVSVGAREFSSGLSYTALSRVRSSKGLLLKPFPFERIANLGKGKRSQERLSEEKRIYEMDGMTPIPDALKDILARIPKPDAVTASARNRPHCEKFHFRPVDPKWKQSESKNWELPCIVPERRAYRCKKMDTNQAPNPKSNGYYSPRGDGNCFYRCISYVLTGCDENYDIFRQHMQILAQGHRDKLFECFHNQVDDDSELTGLPHIDSIFHDGEWAQEMDVYLMAYALRIKIFVFNHLSKAWTEHDPNFLHENNIFPQVNLSTDRAIYLDNQNRDHFAVVQA